MSIRKVPVLEALDELTEIVEDLFLSSITTNEEDARFEELLIAIRSRHEGKTNP